MKKSSQQNIHLFLDTSGQRTFSTANRMDAYGDLDARNACEFNPEIRAKMRLKLERREITSTQSDLDAPICSLVKLNMA
ncbi:MAG: hypothetical protein AAF484_17930 [Pseudomonadota bacterium]